MAPKTIQFIQKGIQLGVRYIRRFGIARGPYFLAKIYVLKGIIQLLLPNYPSPIYLRCGTSDRGVFNEVLVDHEYELTFLNLKPQLIIDAGANVGYTALFFAQQYPKARIFAIEPELSNFELLIQNTRSYQNITPIHAALWSQKTDLEIENPQDRKFEFRVRETCSPRSNSIQAITMSDLLGLAGSERVDILKLDIEGAEKDLFDSHTEAWLDKVSVIIVELHDRFRPGCSSSLYRATSQYKFKQFQRSESTFLVRYDLISGTV